MLLRDGPAMRPAQGPPPPNYQPHAANPESGYVPVGGRNYQNAPPHGYQGAPTPSYQVDNQGNHGGPSPAHPSNNPGYRGGGPVGNVPPPSPGANDNPTYQGVGPSYGGSAQGYPNRSYQEGSGNYNNTAPPAYEGMAGPGRHYQ
ncbi:hypothetical protein ZWY2020_036217 [Hordeum vulgare]|nr:hypothetical protein ZWY2020_036217 [Hordeum vulgare]